jgi:hypothetical protein
MSVSMHAESGSAGSPIIQAVKSGMGVVGEASSAVIFYHIETRMGLKAEDIAANPRRFVWALSSIFGEGAKPIFRSIVNELLQMSLKGLEFSRFATTLNEAIRSEVATERLYLSGSFGDAEGSNSNVSAWRTSSLVEGHVMST